MNQTKNSNTIESKMPQVGEYMDYRKFLSDFFDFKKLITNRDIRPYNYQMFSAAADIKSPNYLKMIIDGKRNLSEEMIIRFARAIGFNKDQTEDFRLLVLLCQATDPGTRNAYLKKLSEHRVKSQLKSGAIDQKTWDKVPNWVAWVIYAMVDQKNTRFDSKNLRKLLRNKATEDEIADAVARLVNSGELSQNAESGELKKTHHLIDSAGDVPVALVRKLQSQLLYLGLESLFEDSPMDREFGALTLSLTKAEFEELKFKLRQMRKTLHKDNAIQRTHNKGDRVYQLNIQLFPVTNIAESSGDDECLEGEIKPLDIQNIVGTENEMTHQDQSDFQKIENS